MDSSSKKMNLQCYSMEDTERVGLYQMANLVKSQMAPHVSKAKAKTHFSFAVKKQKAKVKSDPNEKDVASPVTLIREDGDTPSSMLEAKPSFFQSLYDKAVQAPSRMLFY